LSKKRWQKIERARSLLDLPKKVTLLDIKDAYHKKSIKYHPDKASYEDKEFFKEKMVEINWAYKTLLTYVEHYQIDLSPNEQGMSDEDWWMHHFGQDPIWGGEKEE